MTQQITDAMLNTLAQAVRDRELYFCVGTGQTVTTGSMTDLVGPLNVGDTRNEVRVSGSAALNEFFMEYRLLSTQPTGVQPITLWELGTFNTATDNNDMGTRFVLPTGETKDTPSEWILRLSGKVEEI